MRTRHLIHTFYRSRRMGCWSALLKGVMMGFGFPRRTPRRWAWRTMRGRRRG